MFEYSMSIELPVYFYLVKSLGEEIIGLTEKYYYNLYSLILFLSITPNCYHSLETGKFWLRKSMDDY